MAHRKAARVLPDPVGATTSAWSPRAMACQASRCTLVGSVNDSVNHARVAGENSCNASAMPPFNRMPLTSSLEPASPLLGAHLGEGPGDGVDGAAHLCGIRLPV